MKRCVSNSSSRLQLSVNSSFSQLRSPLGSCSTNSLPIMSYSSLCKLTNFQHSTCLPTVFKWATNLTLTPSKQTLDPFSPTLKYNTLTLSASPCISTIASILYLPKHFKQYFLTLNSIVFVQSCYTGSISFVSTSLMFWVSIFSKESLYWMEKQSGGKLRRLMEGGRRLGRCRLKGRQYLPGRRVQIAQIMGDQLFTQSPAYLSSWLPYRKVSSVVATVLLLVTSFRCIIDSIVYSWKLAADYSVFTSDLYGFSEQYTQVPSNDIRKSRLGIVYLQSSTIWPDTSSLRSMIRDFMSRWAVNDGHQQFMEDVERQEKARQLMIKSSFIGDFIVLQYVIVFSVFQCNNGCSSIKYALALLGCKRSCRSNKVVLSIFFILSLSSFNPYLVPQLKTLYCVPQFIILFQDPNMGNLTQPHGQGSDYNPILKDWQQIGSYDGYPVWRNHKTNQQMQQYKYMAHNSTDLRRLKNLFQFRHNNPTLVSTHYFNDSQLAGVQGSHHIISMFSEKIATRLSQIPSVPYPDLLHLYKNVLQGFEQLYKKVGHLEVSEEMVGVNNFGQAKVWLHPDWSNDRPQRNQSVTKGEIAIVQDIVRMIQRKSQLLTEPEPLGMFLLASPLHSFQGSLIRLQQFAQKHYTVIPERMETIHQLVRAGHFRGSPSRSRFSSNRSSPSHPIASRIHQQTTKTVSLQTPVGALPVIPGLPLDTRITEIDADYLPSPQSPSRVAIPPGVLPQNMISMAPIFGPTPIGMRPISPARIVIRAQSPLRPQSPIRAHSPLPRVIQSQSRLATTQLHPSLASEHIPIPGVSRSIVGLTETRTKTVLPVAPLAPPIGANIISTNADSVLTHTQPVFRQGVPAPSELSSLSRKIQQELDRVSNLIQRDQGTNSVNPIAPLIAEQLNYQPWQPQQSQPQTQTYSSPTPQPQPQPQQQTYSPPAPPVQQASAAAPTYSYQNSRPTQQKQPSYQSPSPTPSGPVTTISSTKILAPTIHEAAPSVTPKPAAESYSSISPISTLPKQYNFSNSSYQRKPSITRVAESQAVNNTSTGSPANNTSTSYSGYTYTNPSSTSGANVTSTSYKPQQPPKVIRISQQQPKRVSDSNQSQQPYKYTATEVLSSNKADTSNQPKYDFSGVSSSFEKTTGSTAGMTRKSFQGTNYIRVSAQKIEGDTDGVKVLYHG